VYVAVAALGIAVLTWLVPNPLPFGRDHGQSPIGDTPAGFPTKMAGAWAGQLAPTSSANQLAPHDPWQVTIRLDRNGKGYLGSKDEACETELVWKGPPSDGKHKFSLRVPPNAPCHNGTVDLAVAGGSVNAWLTSDDRLAVEIVADMLAAVVSTGTLQRS
jgi:hypothetical protein